MTLGELKTLIEASDDYDLRVCVELPNGELVDEADIKISVAHGRFVVLVIESAAAHAILHPEAVTLPTSDTPPTILHDSGCAPNKMNEIWQVQVRRYSDGEVIWFEQGDGDVEAIQRAAENGRRVLAVREDLRCESLFVITRDPKEMVQVDLEENAR